SLIEVELKRRHDLIPALVSTLTGLREHEASLQTALASLRAQQAATPPGVTGPDFQGLAASLRVVAENYPELKTQAEFARLHTELVTTEQRVALARTYYNDTATYFATRLEQVPDRWVARLGRMQPAPLLAASDFERAEVRVHFADGE
ncbi:MAG TPA: LemA family protein, partial [Acidobacteriota bacterium]|nr:LemA family protein [Acidobacteriota bacterium]